ncbi:response regulator transcription factor [Amycolatopsis sp. NPDC049252]|uniref:response regulator transcription factor n=1 Tax=Amycolatopsis sp. NPDC049252 TaxID=3363933 RepID=UPI00371FA4FA
MDAPATLPGKRGATGRLVLVVDDDPRVRTVVTWQLEAEGFRVAEAPDGRRALETIGREQLDLVILDLALPGVGGLDVLRRLRSGERGAALPVIVLSGRSGETDRIVGLDLGADDYLVKPFSPGELVARVRSVLRRAAPAPPVTAAGLRIDHAAREVFLDGREITTTAKEFDLLAFLSAHPRQVFTRAQLLESVWASAAEWQSEATVTEHVHRLRQKLGPGLVRTVRGVGYRLEP